jgi:hypothetical protein
LRPSEKKNNIWVTDALLVYEWIFALILYLLFKGIIFSSRQKENPKNALERIYKKEVNNHGNFFKRASEFPQK